MIADKRIYDVAIVGSGPAGLSAAIEIAECGCNNVIVIDENFRPGGQLFKQTHKFFGSKEQYAGIRGFRIGEMLLKQALDLGVEILLGTSVIGIFEPSKEVKTLGVFNQERGAWEIYAKNVIIATGAQENAIAFLDGRYLV